MLSENDCPPDDCDDGMGLVVKRSNVLDTSGTVDRPQTSR